jgi:aminobenzoyl-glutamate transport protein
MGTRHQHEARFSPVLDWIERIGNRLPEPAVLFMFGTALIMVLSQIAYLADWSVVKPIAQSSATGSVINTVEIHAIGLLTSDGLWWAVSHMVENFINFPPLGLVLVGMLGIGIAERSGLLAAMLSRGMTLMPDRMLTPTMIFIGVMSSLALDAGYIVLPPLAAAIYYAAGRPPLAGIAAVFAGVSAGFSANLFITAVDPLLSGLTQAGAAVLDPGYRVAVTCNWWFMIASTLLITISGWMVSAWLVEPRLRYAWAGPNADEYERDTDSRKTSASGEADERRGLVAAGLAFTAILVIVLGMILYPGAPLNGRGDHFSRWIEASVPLLFVIFFVPGLVYGLVAGSIKDNKDVARMLGDTISSLGPYIVLAFFAAQFIEYFNYSNLGVMIAIVGGQALAQSSLDSSLLITAFILVVLVGNLFIGSAAYRIGDSASNVIAPLNPYIVIVLAMMQKYARNTGIGSLVSIMLPYTLTFAALWAILLIGWMLTGADLGPGGPLDYIPG